MQHTRMEQGIATMFQSFHESQEQETATGKERINKERVKLNDAEAQATKSEANIREATKVRIEKMVAENGSRVQKVKDSMVSTFLHLA